MLKRFLYLDEPALTDYLSGLEGGLRDAVQRRQLSTGKIEGGIDLTIVKGGGDHTIESEESFTISDTPQTRFDRLVTLAEADAELSGWVEVLDPNEGFQGIGIGAMVSLECEIYIPDAVKPFVGGEIAGALDMMSGLMPFAETFGFDTNGVPAASELVAMKQAIGTINANPVIVGELDDSDWRIASELNASFIKGELEGNVRLVGKVTKQWPQGQWKPMLALPGSNLLPRQKRRELERTRPTAGKEDDFLEGPAVMLDVLAIYR